MSFYTTTHQKRQWGERGEKTACHLFALIQDRTSEGREGSANAHVCLCGSVCPAHEGTGFGGSFLNFLY